MAETEPVGSIGIAQGALRDMLADSPAFRAWTGALDHPAAKARVYEEGLPPPADPKHGYSLEEWAAYRPYAVLWTDRSQGLQFRRSSSTGFSDSGRLVLYLQQHTPVEVAADTAECERRWIRTLDRILGDLIAMAGESGIRSYLDIRQITLEEVYQNDPEQKATEGEFQTAIISISWGAEG
jgi:hypothetical protein